MGRVCARHEQFYETECLYCEPASPIQHLAAAIRQVVGPVFTANPRSCGHLHPAVNRDACNDCGMSGLEMLQRGQRYTPIE